MRFLWAIPFFSSHIDRFAEVWWRGTCATQSSCPIFYWLYLSLLPALTVHPIRQLQKQNLRFPFYLTRPRDFVALFTQRRKPRPSWAYLMELWHALWNMALVLNTSLKTQLSDWCSTGTRPLADTNSLPTLRQDLWFMRGWLDLYKELLAPKKTKVKFFKRSWRHV